MRRVRNLIVGTSLAFAFLALPSAVLAADISVNSVSDASSAGDGDCTLREAIVAANLDAANTNADCPDGSAGELDVIYLDVDGTITLTSNLPDIEGQLEILGDRNVTVNGGDAFRPFRVVSGALTIRGLTIRDGYGGGGFGFGGAVSNGATTTIIDSTIRSSRAGYGGAIHNNGVMTISRSTIQGNDAETAGGGIYNEGVMSLRNVTISGNDAPAGAGIYTSSTATVAHATIAFNRAAAGGGGGVNKAGGAFTLTNSIVAGNTGKQVVGTEAVSSLVRASASGVIDAVLSDNGGPTRTHRLLKGSPAERIGDPGWCGFAEYVDQRGVARPSGPSATCDAGAVQRDRKAPVFTVQPRILFRDSGRLSGSSFPAWISGWSADDGDGSGLARFSVQRQVNGGKWRSVAANLAVEPDILAAPGTGELKVSLAKDTRYRFRIRAVDEDRNRSAWAYTPTVTARLYQQSSSRLTFSDGWTTKRSTKFSGGSAKSTTVDGASVRMRFTGRAFAFVTTVRAGQPVEVFSYLDGQATGMNSYSVTETAHRLMAWPMDWKRSERHVVRYVTQGTSRFTADAIAVLE